MVKLQITISAMLVNSSRPLMQPYHLTKIATYLNNNLYIIPSMYIANSYRQALVIIL